jgi:hypothetical protein
MKKFKNRTACLKFQYKFKCTEVTLYFDCYDEVVPTISMILHREKQYYFKSFNLGDINSIKRYMDNLPENILEDILENKSLEEFYRELKSHLLTSDCQPCNYEKDIRFINTLKYQKNKYEINPFFSHLRHVHMQDKQLDLLNTYLSIPKNILKSLQTNGFTIVTTANPGKRTSLHLELKKYSIQI